MTIVRDYCQWLTASEPVYTRVKPCPENIFSKIAESVFCDAYQYRPPEMTWGRARTIAMRVTGQIAIGLVGGMVISGLIIGIGKKREFIEGSTIAHYSKKPKPVFTDFNGVDICSHTSYRRVGQRSFSYPVYKPCKELAEQWKFHVEDAKEAVLAAQALQEKGWKLFVAASTPFYLAVALPQRILMKTIPDSLMQIVKMPVEAGEDLLRHIGL